MYRRMRAVSLELEEVGIRHIIGPKKLRRSLAGSADPEALDTLASVIEPVSFGDREDTQHTDSYTSLNRLVDAVVADPPTRQQMARDIDTLLSTPHSPEAALAVMRLRHRFESWQEVSPSLQALCQRSSRLNDAADRARQLGQLARAGLESLAYLENHTAAPAGWADQQTAILTDAQKPSALVKFVFLPDLEKLVKAAAAR
jgi:hexosaminidase